ncbi:hypothetical protein [Empedobacter sedimenti]|uniref:hypothetical protein n=1 Tax=Empedobacter sedimenti TaxID=3042610 RepID=UPI0024A63600|nr:hypothetical protein [Empedobacter sedimenti]
MKQLLFTLLLSSSLFAQEKATDLFNANVSLIGIGIQYEKALSENFTAIGTLDYIGGFSYTEDWNGEGDFNYILTTSIDLEGRYYYNFNRRISKNKNTKNNSANYIALKANFIPDLLTLKNAGESLKPQGRLTLNYGLKRSFAQNFFYEFYTGLGIALYQNTNVYDDYDYTTQTSHYRTVKTTDKDVALDLGFRVGYNF